MFYRAKIEIICRKSTEMLIYMKDYPLISATQILIFLISMCSLIFGILLKLESIDLRIDLSPLTISIIAIAIIISSSLMVVIAFYFIFMGILTRRRKRVDKIYQRIKKRQRKQVQLIPVINISWDTLKKTYNTYLPLQLIIYNIYLCLVCGILFIFVLKIISNKLPRLLVRNMYYGKF